MRIDAGTFDSGPKETLASAIYSQLRGEIIRTEIAPGARLKIQTLCNRFSVGQSPVREALSRLSSEGLVAQFDQRGFSVAPLSETELTDLTRSRCWVSEVALRESIKNGKTEWEEGIVVAFYRLSREQRLHGDTDGGSQAWAEAHFAFHKSLTAASGSELMTEFGDRLFERAERYRCLARRIRKVRTTVSEEHKAIMEATVSRDADTAVSLLVSHFRKTEESCRKALATANEEIEQVA